MQHRIAEIKGFIAHGDFSLAVRRMLDLCLDAGDESILRSAISWSRNYREAEKLNNAGLIVLQFEKDATDLITKLENSIERTPVQPFELVNVNQISKTYSKSNFSLAPISLEIKTSDVVGVVGENGNGKTTLLRCLSGQLSLDNGTITYSQLPDPDHYSIKHHVAFIPQRIPKWYGMLKDNLHFSAAMAGITGRQNDLMVDFMLERLNLSHYAHLTWNRISSGYRTRFEIARVLLQKPSLLILDEPLANLDINAQQTMLTDLRYLAKSQYHPMGIILSSQQLHEVEKVADSVLLIKQGKCLFRTGEMDEKEISFALEIETPADRDSLVSVLGTNDLHVQFNGGFYTITSTTRPVHSMITTLLNNEIKVTYFRDITHSTKRYF
jgi:ABC-2 type transport system ATP-binding protein